MSNSRLSSRDRLLLSIGAVAMLAVLGALQCAAFSVDESLRALLSVSASTLAALCAAILLQDAIAPALAAAGRWLRRARLASA
jgi:hypothetical protein